MFSAVVLASVLSVVSAYSKCSPSDVKGPSPAIPITKVLASTNIEISGNIEIVDGCTFKVTGFTLTNAGATRWFGGKGADLLAINLSDTPVSASATPGEQTFVFRNAVGSEASFRDFDEFRLLDESTQTLIATAKVPAAINGALLTNTLPGKTGTGPAPGAGAGSPAKTTPKTSTPATTGQPAAESAARQIGDGILGLLLMAFV